MLLDTLKRLLTKFKEFVGVKKSEPAPENRGLVLVPFYEDPGEGFGQVTIITGDRVPMLFRILFLGEIKYESGVRIVGKDNLRFRAIIVDGDEIISKMPREYWTCNQYEEVITTLDHYKTWKNGS